MLEKYDYKRLKNDLSYQLNEMPHLVCSTNKAFEENKKGQEANFSDLSLMVTPTGFEPISSEPESEILSIELGSHYFN